MQRGVPARQASASLLPVDGTLLAAGAHLTVQIARHPAVPLSIALEAHDNKLCLAKAHQALLPCWPALMPIAPADAAAAARGTSVQFVMSNVQVLKSSNVPRFQCSNVPMFK